MPSVFAFLIWAQNFALNKNTLGVRNILRYEETVVVSQAFEETVVETSNTFLL